MKKYQKLVIDIQIFNNEVEMLSASIEAQGTTGDIYNFNGGWVTGGES